MTSVTTMNNITTTKASTGRKVLSALAIAAVVGVTLAPAAASARGGHHHYGYGAAALAGGLVLGAIAASAAEPAYDEPACWTEKRVRYDADGYRYVQKVRICD